jgi:hypothetical protein
LFSRYIYIDFGLCCFFSSPRAVAVWIFIVGLTSGLSEFAETGLASSEFLMWLTIPLALFSLAELALSGIILFQYWYPRNIIGLTNIQVILYFVTLGMSRFLPARGMGIAVLFTVFVGGLFW